MSPVLYVGVIKERGTMDETNLIDDAGQPDDAIQEVSEIEPNEPENVEDVQEVEEVSEAPEETETNDESELSPRQQKRVEQIERKAKEYQLNSILDRIQGKQPQQTGQHERLDYREAIEAPEEVYQTLERERETIKKESFNEGLEAVKAIEFKNNIRFDLPLVKDRLDKLDPIDAATLDREYLLTVGFNPQTGAPLHTNVGYAEYINSKLDMMERFVAAKTARSQQNIAKQASQTGVRPDGGTRPSFNITSANDIAKLSPEQFEKNREAIYKAAGIPYNK